MKVAARFGVLGLGLGLLSSVGCAPSSAVDDDHETDGHEPVEDQNAEVGSGTVAQATSSSCSTATIRPLSQQILDEMVCVDPTKFSRVPDLPNVVIPEGVFPYLGTAAKDAFVEAVAKKPNSTLTVNSMFRTVGQQYMVRRWYLQGRCGISAAAKPGNSNHESGLAIDVANYSTFQAVLESEGFDWFGSSDKPHFDYEGPGAENFKGLDVLAFQRLWNRNHPEDTIAEDGEYGPQTEARLKASPAAGFPVGAECNAEPEPEPEPDPGVDPESCSAFPSESEFTCSGDGNSRGICEGEQASIETCDNGCLIRSGSDICMGTSSNWSCNGTTGTTKMQDGDYYATSFGCSMSANGSVLEDSGDNCIPACLSTLRSQGVCSPNQTGRSCELQITWFMADRDRFGCGKKVRVTNPQNGKSTVVMVVDAGPACWVENNVDHAIADLSYRTTEYLFGGAQGASDESLVHLVEVADDTPLGPVE